MYLPTVRLSDGMLEQLTMVPFRIRNFRLNRVRREDARWLSDTLSREGTPVGTRIRLEDDNSMTLEWR
jgi:poly-gamma-glutamate capsule biosynthesis protein CapA/YwtB (metallophosphatase superfamily)